MTGEETEEVRERAGEDGEEEGSSTAEVEVGPDEQESQAHLELDGIAILLLASCTSSVYTPRQSGLLSQGQLGAHTSKVSVASLADED